MARIAGVFASTDNAVQYLSDGDEIEYLFPASPDATFADISITTRWILSCISPEPSVSDYLTHAVVINPDFDVMDTSLPNTAIHIRGFDSIEDTSLFTLCIWLNPNIDVGYSINNSILSLQLNTSLNPPLTGGPSDPYNDPRVNSGISIGINDFISESDPKTQYSIEWDLRSDILDLGGNPSNVQDWFSGHTDSIPLDGNWHCIRLAIDVGHASGDRIVSASLDGAPISTTIDNDYGSSFVIPMSNVLMDRLVLFLGVPLESRSLFHTCVSAMWISPGQYVTNDTLFRDADTGKPINLGIYGSLPTGTSPAFYFDLRDSTTPGDFLINKGLVGGTAQYYRVDFIDGDVTTGVDTYSGIFGNDFTPAVGDVWLYSYDYDSHAFPPGATVTDWDSGTNTITFDNVANTVSFTPTSIKSIIGRVNSLTLCETSPSD
jgi:hypothetical protein